MRLTPLTFCLTLIGLPAGLHAQSGQDVSSSSASDRIIIFFDWDRPVIGGDAAAQLDAVVAQAKNAPNTRIELSGHADRSGPEGPNVRSAKARAEAVRAYLEARGVPGSKMRVQSLGENQPLIRTADGVREPQNRRVEIVLTR